MYTVRQLARLAGITPRTLRYYDEIGLLKPSQVGDNGYRYYAEAALLRLQQILLYRQLEVPLEQIRRILDGQDFDLLQALESHRRALNGRIAHLQRLVATVEHTLAYLKGNADMRPNQLFEVFNEEQQAAYEQEALRSYDPATVKASYAKWRRYTTAEKQRIGDEGNAIYQDMLQAMDKGPAAPEVQACIERWRRHMDYFWTPDLEQLQALAEHYSLEPRFKANFDRLHPQLAEFMGQAVRVYVQRQKAGEN